MQARFLVAGLAAALAFFLVHPAAAVAQGQSLKQQKKQRIRIPFTPMNEDGTPGSPVMLSIRVEADDQAQAVQALDQVMDLLVVQPKIDDLTDQIDEYIKNKLKATSLPEGQPEESDDSEDPTTRKVEGPAGRPWPITAYLDATCSENQGCCNVEETVEGLLEALDQVGNYLGFRSLLRTIEVSLASSQRKAVPPTGIDDKQARKILESLKALERQLAELKSHVSSMPAPFSWPGPVSAFQGSSECPAQAPLVKRLVDHLSNEHAYRAFPDHTGVLGPEDDQFRVPQGYYWQPPDWLKSAIPEPAEEQSGFGSLYLVR
jgi:hypothetical protein